MTPDEATPAEPGRQRYIAIALTACAVVLFEVAVTRLLSVVLWYHFAFLSLSVAMLGLGAPGVWFALRRPRDTTLRRSLMASAILMPLAVFFIVSGKPWVEGAGFGSTVWVIAVVLAMLAPMLALGTAVCVLLIEARGRAIGRMYGADLLGAMVGALVAVPLLGLFPAPILLALGALLPVVAWFLAGGRPAWLGAVVAVALLGTAVWGQPYQVSYTKTYSETRHVPVHEQWSPTARITVFERPIWNRGKNSPWAWGMGSKYVPKPVKQMWIDQDGSAGTPIENITGDVVNLEHLAYDVTGVGYQLASPKKACVIGAGGGRDVLSALQFGATEVDAVELNGVIVEVVSETFGDFSGNVYNRPGVRPVVSEGRSFLTRTDARYDMIQVSLVDSWAATAAGAYALSENFLYTLEAFQLYWERLTPGGMVSVSRWTKGIHQLEGARVANLAVEALASLGVENPRQHIGFVDAGAVGTLLVSRKPFTREVVAELDAISVKRGFRRLWPPSRDTVGAPVVRVLAKGIGPYQERGFDLSAPTDDRPFFFQTVSLLGDPDPAILQQLGFNEQSVTVLKTFLLALVILAAVLFFLPFVLARKLTRAPGFWRGSVYFAAIGLAFMLVEIPWIQQSILYLGHPSEATAIVLAALLLGAGLGSMAAARVPLDRIKSLSLLLPLGVLLVHTMVGALYDATLGAPRAVRIGLCLLSMAPAGFLMGFAFPAGMLCFAGQDTNKAWFWAINGAFGVVASAVSLALAMLIGFSAVAGVGAIAYLVAALLLRAHEPDAA